jgi:hypothetical protein
MSKQTHHEEYLKTLAQQLKERGINAHYNEGVQGVDSIPETVWLIPTEDGTAYYRFVVFYEPVSHFNRKAKWSFTCQHSEFGHLRTIPARSPEEITAGVAATLNPEWRATLQETKQYKKSSKGRGKKYLTSADLVKLNSSTTAKEIRKVRNTKAKLEQQLDKLRGKVGPYYDSKRADLAARLFLADNYLTTHEAQQFDLLTKDLGEGKP